jgi:hypothetical protein
VQEVAPCRPCPDARIVQYSERIGVHWVWYGGLNSTGYPRLKIKGKYESVHVYWWEAVHGPVPIGEDGKKLTVDHTCQYGKLCVWPGCKRLLTREANTQDRWERSRDE